MTHMLTNTDTHKKVLNGYSTITDKLIGASLKYMSHTLITLTRLPSQSIFLPLDNHAKTMFLKTESMVTAQ